MDQEKITFLAEVEKLMKRYELAAQVSPDYYEPGMMEFLEHYYGFYDETTGEVTLRFEVKGTRYEGRTEIIETVNVGDEIQLERDETNPFNPNNFTFLTTKKQNLGHLPANLCNAIAPLYDAGKMAFGKTVISYVEPISKRSRHAKQAILFVELTGILK